MKQVLLKRQQSSSQGTLGFIFSDNFSCFTLELPWKQNQRKVSCIPNGRYTCVVRQSPKFGLVYHVQNVPGRSYILFHSGNWAGDKSKGYRSNVEGCILLGRYHGILRGQKAVLVSRPAVTDFMLSLHNKPFELIIEGDPEWTV